MVSSVIIALIKTVILAFVSVVFLGSIVSAILAMKENYVTLKSTNAPQIRVLMMVSASTY